MFRLGSQFTDNPNYRPDIDGLRAIAVILVILFHLEVPGFEGGYLGVDIFFVITGYLITQHVAGAIGKGSFGLLHFYERRVKRLVPSLVVALIFTMAGAIMLFSPDDLVKTAESMGASIFSAANIFFYMQDSYFADNYDTPLLHLWSLGVEAQFYLVWPLIILLALKKLAKMPWLVFAIVALASYGAAQWVATIDPDAVFFLTPLRLIEFIAGGALIFIPKIKHPSAHHISAGIGVLGLAFMAFGVAASDPKSAVLSMYVLMVCAGSAMLIYAGGPSLLLRAIMGNPVSAYIGRISYELYLFHWPLIVFYVYVNYEPVPTELMPVVVGATFILSALTYHFVSCPLRYGFNASKAQRENFLIGCLAVAAILLLLALMIRNQHGWFWRIPERAAMFTSQMGTFHNEEYGGVGFVEGVDTMGAEGTPVQFIMVGDSFAGQYALAFDAALKARNQSALLVHKNACLISPDVTVKSRGVIFEGCATMYATLQETLAKHPGVPIIYTQSWTTYKGVVVTRDGNEIPFAEENNNDYYAYMIKMVDVMRGVAAGRRFMFTGVQPGIEDRKSLTRCFRVPQIIPNKCSAHTGVPEEKRLHGQEFNVVAEKYAQENPDAIFINPRTALCRDGLCQAIKGDKIFYSDLMHFTKDGAGEVISFYEDVIFPSN